LVRRGQTVLRFDPDQVAVEPEATVALVATALAHLSR
jgi:hypothetical protein